MVSHLLEALFEPESTSRSHTLNINSHSFESSLQAAAGSISAIDLDMYRLTKCHHRYQDARNVLFAA
jgi:hypothetical protein